mmetsp:Transcript_57527/g.171558  ORF Transcript_57527/g.171558 Transcript_57527/m.171558 type:complete len:216 (+) Transcript_57527:871-1518(+)
MVIRPKMQIRRRREIGETPARIIVALLGRGGLSTTSCELLITLLQRGATLPKVECKTQIRSANTLATAAGSPPTQCRPSEEPHLLLLPLLVLVFSPPVSADLLQSPPSRSFRRSKWRRLPAPELGPRSSVSSSSPLPHRTARCCMNRTGNIKSPSSRIGEKNERRERKRRRGNVPKREISWRRSGPRERRKGNGRSRKPKRWMVWGTNRRGTTLT